jgi:formylglycine-generating enzyme required for sulfatase activity
VLANQPVVGVSLHEAQAYATAHGARLLEFDERVRVMRGNEKRPYPWGAPFGQNNANTREEVLGRPSAVGIFPRDRTPEGVCDLAGNVGEWTADSAGDRQVIHPGSWEQPSMAAWAKALRLISPAARSASLGFRLARDL